ncbi:MAG TPA: alpha/beta hydrolase [Desulfotignum sp.]|nr:alpha/beta hydrolase [Desulfotignum sp.]
MQSKFSVLKTRFTVEGLTLTGELFLPDTSQPPLVVGSHGLEGSRLSAKQRVLSCLLPENGMAFFRFDHRGCGDSHGDFVSDTSLATRTKDLVAAVEHALHMDMTSLHLGVFGSSMGGAACINAWQVLEKTGVNVCGGVLCAAPVKSRTIKNIPTRANDIRPALPLDFFKENLLFDLTHQAEALHHVLIFHGDADQVVPVSNAHTLFDSMQPPGQCIIQKGGDHQMSSKDHQAEFETLALAWYKKIFATF